MTKESELIKQGSTFLLTATHEDEGQRIDKFITQHFSQYSRSFLQKLFTQKHILINKTKTAKPGYSLKLGDQILVSFPKQNLTQPVKDIPENIGVEIIAKEKDFLIINKPAGLVVHPPNETCQDIALTDWLAKTYDEIAHVGLVDRPGIVHRLDKDTSGLMIIPRTNQAHATMTDMFKNRKIHKTYLAIVVGHPPKQGTIDFYIGRHPVIRHKMHHFTDLTKQPSSRSAISHYTVIDYYKDFSLVEVRPLTGRTHQIRVHFAAIGHPILADYIYGQKSKLTKRHALHAHKLEFEFNGKQYSFTSAFDPDLQTIINNSQKAV
ncbi:MAG: RluA family pseudouridine synthase [Epsilonproteobacteria bacterium]|nr:RluA family pseudouridine synthase [Campylobacterota bacterium]|tara:strand:- start:2992 stop:3954 length:963 start_codon:yes stop_codon:yes gene_type:complete